MKTRENPLEGIHPQVVRLARLMREPGTTEAAAVLMLQKALTETDWLARNYSEFAISKLEASSAKRIAEAARTANRG